MEAFGRWVESHEFKNDLCEAAKDPISPKAKCLLKRIVPHVRTCVSQIPYFVSQRKSSLRNFLLIFFGKPSVFLTFSPDDINVVLNICLQFRRLLRKDFLLKMMGSWMVWCMESHISRASQSINIHYESV